MLPNHYLGALIALNCYFQGLESFSFKLTFVGDNRDYGAHCHLDRCLGQDIRSFGSMICPDSSVFAPEVSITFRFSLGSDHCHPRQLEGAQQNASIWQQETSYSSN